MSYYDCEEIADLEQEILALKRERASLLRKLKGVRAARVRDQTKSSALLHNCIEAYNCIIQGLVDKATAARADKLDFIFWWLSHNWIESGKMTQSEWEGAYLAALNEYTKKHKKES